jgi:CheY-like chemotaxis protein
MSHEPLVILLAEDDDGHAQLVQRNLKRSGVVNTIVHVRDGQEALDYIRSQGDYASRPRRTHLLVLLDINMPRVDGVEVLRQIKDDPQHNKLPVIMLTTTDDPREIENCYQLGCSIYVTKPVAYEAFVEAVSRLGLFLQIVQVPSEVELVEA